MGAKNKVLAAATVAVAMACGNSGNNGEPDAPAAGADAGADEEAPVAASVRFVDVAAEAGLTEEIRPTRTEGDCEDPCMLSYMAGSGAVGDYNDDGHPDIFIARPLASDLLYRNRGDGTFEDVSAKAGFTEVSSNNGAAFLDIDRDADLDLLVGGYGDTRIRLYVNEGGVFSEQGRERGVAFEEGYKHYTQGFCVGDYDLDGYMDFQITEWLAAPMVEGRMSHNRLMRNRGADGPGTFEDVTLPAGVSMENAADGVGDFGEGVFGFACAISDLDHDGHPDLAIAADFGSSKLFWNNGDGTFTDGTAAAGVGTDENGMGSTIADYDGDGLLDWFVSAIACLPGETSSAISGTGEHACSQLGNRMYKNAGNRTFIDVTDEAGVRDGGWGWGTSFLDYDNDGDLDLALANGFAFPPMEIPDYGIDPMAFWANDGAGGMTDVAAQVGLAGTRSGKGLMVLDMEGDGDQDIFVLNDDGRPQLFKNDGGNQAGNWLQIKARGKESNLNGIGAKFRITHESDAESQNRGVIIARGGQYREVTGASNFQGQNDSLVHFGGLTGPVTVEVEFLGGKRRVLTDVEPNQRIEIVEVEATPSP